MSVTRHRWWVLRALGRNPLIRRTDRLEAWAMVLAAVCAVLVIPPAVSVGHSVHADGLRTAEIQAQTRTMVQATVLTDTNTTPIADPGAAVVTVTWTANGSSHTGVLRPGRSIKPGATVPIWVDQTGRRVPPPISPAGAQTYATAAAVSVWLGSVVLCGLVLVAIRALADRRRRRTWSAELRILLDHGDGRTKWHH